MFLINRYGVVFWIELDSLNRDRRSAHISGDFFEVVSIEAPLSSLKKRIICILKNCFKKGSNASIIECIGIAGCPIMSISPLKWPTPPYRKSSKTYHFAIHVESIKPSVRGASFSRTIQSHLSGRKYLSFRIGSLHPAQSSSCCNRGTSRRLSMECSPSLFGEDCLRVVDH